MRQETNNEMDLLLRRLSRRQGVPASDDDLRIDSDHLDPDELSSYAENALPAAARARYTEHLADCSKCRELVVQLSASVPVVAAKDTVTASAPSGLGRFLTSFFSPMVLRYAVPALGLIVVAAIGFVVLRSNQPRQMAQLTNEAPTSPAAVPSTEPQQLSEGLHDSQERTEPQSPATRPPIVERSGDLAGQAPAPQSTPPASSPSVTQETAPPAAKTEARVVANEAPAQPAPKPAASVDEMRVEVEGRRRSEQAPTSDLAKAQTVDASKDQEKKTGELQSASRPARTPGGARGQTGGASATFGVQEKNRDDSAIRAAGGRRFRRQNGVWVDTAYNSGSAISLNLSRSSEQYRTLVADEPGIKTIADELDGTIIVVWKGRTYRIQ